MKSRFILKLALIIVFIPHAVGKLVATPAFDAKFAVPGWQTIVLGIIELVAALLIVASIFTGDIVDEIFTYIASVGIIVSQILAIIYAAFPRWLFFNGGMEFNIVLILITLYLSITLLSRRYMAKNEIGGK